MSFFGQQNNQQQGTGFGGFGSNNQTGSGFGQSSASNTSFGSGTTLGGGSSTSGGFGGFGSGGTTGFGSAPSNTTPFGQNRPAFGASTTTSGGGLFGSGTATAGGSGGFGGFGGTTNNNTAGGSLFGSTAAKPAFGGSTGGGLFGGGNAGGGFGSTNTQQTPAFGAPASSALGQNNAECQGTGSTPFQAWTEKEGAGSMTNHFQSISFMAPYRNFSFEELRLADYNQGRRYGNGSGQAGAFGSTNFGGFGQQNTTGGFGQTANTGGGLFGQPAASSSPFGTGQPAQSGFGASNAGGGLFGQKSGGLFGQPATTASSAQPSGGLFGTAGATGGFGSGNTGGFGSGSGGGLFGGGAQQQQQSKPFSFGSQTATSGGFGSGTTGGFGSTTNTGGGMFGGSAQTNSPFGQAQQQQPAQTSNPFGSFGQQNQTQANTGSAFGGFGQQNQEQKPGGLFGSTTGSNTGGLFGGAGQTTNQQQPAGGGLFGAQGNNQSSGSSLFAPKPATGGTGLFGQSNTANSNSGGGLFGGFGNSNNNNQNQQQGGGLFGNTSDQQQKPGGLFGSTSNTSGGGLFGSTGNNNQQQSGGGGMFGSLGSTNQQPQQQQSGGLFGGSTNNQGSSLFGQSQPQQQQQPQQPQQANAFQGSQTLQTSIMDPNAFGSPSIFSGLPPPPQVSGPIATPISAKKSMRKSAILPHYKMTPNAASRFQTPQKRGFGFSYSTYGTPGSVSSNTSTPGGLSSSFMYGSVGRGLGKSLSTSNLRRNYDDPESILTPGAFSAGSSRYGGSGSLKRLTIDRSLRTDLFGDRGTPPALPSPEKERQAGILKKRVSFDQSAQGGNGEAQNGAQVNGNETNNPALPSAEEQGYLRSPRKQAISKPNGLPTQSELEQVRGNELAIVHEDESPDTMITVSAQAAAPGPAPTSQVDQQPGPYWMKPSKEVLQKMSLDERRKVPGFSVGRNGCGRVEFNKPVDLTLTPLDDIFGNIVLVELRSLTVYPDQSKKPAMGKGLNVPSTLYLENSWPRQKDRKTPLHEKSGPRFNKHVDRLRKVGGTEFVRYEKETGTWVFKVPHFTTYGFDYDEEASEGESLQTSMLSEPPDTPTPKSRVFRNNQTPTATESTQRSFQSSIESSYVTSSPEDTFEFRKKKKLLPGAFDEAPISDEEDLDQEMQVVTNNDQSFLDERLAASPSDSGEDEPSEPGDVNGEDVDRSLVVRDEDKDLEMEMAGAFPLPDFEESTVKNGQRTPGKGTFSVTSDWAQELQRTISPRKQDRQALRETQTHVLEKRELDHDNTPSAKPSGKRARPDLATSIDLMNSLFGQEQARRSESNAKQAAMGTGFKWPYAKKSKIDDDDGEMTEQVRLLHEGYKPAWAPGATLMYSIPGKVGISRNMSTQTDTILIDMKGAVVSERRDIRFAKFAVVTDLTPESLTQQRAHTKFTLDRGIPMATLQHTPFRDVASAVHPDSDQEKAVWVLASILFDEQDPEAFGVPRAQKDKFDDRIRKDRLIAFWERLCDNSTRKAVDEAPTAEERAIAHLSGHRIVEACDALLQGKDFRLATLVAQIGGDQIMRDDMASQIKAWRDLKVLSEMTEPIRALYSLLAGETCICEGNKGQLEDRARTFVISERFGLDWKRAFGLRLFYSIRAEQPIEDAIANFENDLKADEGKKPIPWFVESGPSNNSRPSEREDILWGILKLYSASKRWLPLPSLAEIIMPQNTSPNPLSTRLSFQLYHALTLRFPAASNTAAADALAHDFATQLDAAGEWLWALFAALHLSTPVQRQNSIQALLAQHAADFTADPSDARFLSLTEDLKIPSPWIWQAKALHVRSVTQDHVREVGYLVKAGDWTEAHSVLRHVVGPQCVIEEEWGVLQGLLDGFKPGKEYISDWGLGGGLFEDYLALLKGVQGKEKVKALRRLLDALPNMAKEERGRKPEFKELVAVQEISGLVGKEVLTMRERENGIDGAKVLQLPLTADAYSKHTTELSLQYYKTVMAGGS